MRHLYKTSYLFAIFSLIFCINPSFAETKELKCAELVPSPIEKLKTYSLLDEEHEIAANYVPILPLRTFVHADIYKDKKSVHLDRHYYLKDASGKFGDPYQKISLNIIVKGHGFLGREIIAEGTLNKSILKYRNTMGFSLPKRAHMDIDASLDGVPILDLTVHSDGDKMTNDVKGTFLNREVNYHTDWRETKGTLAGLPYLLHTEGVEKTPNSFKGITAGKFNKTTISGDAKMVRPGYYESVEYYGPIMVKSTIKVL